MTRLAIPDGASDGRLASQPPRRVARTALVALVWGVGAVPMALGRARCPVAYFLRTPCPGCGLTRAGHLLEAGRVLESLRMQPFLVPSALATTVLALATLWLTYRTGSPLELWSTRPTRAAVIFFVAVNVGMLLLWVARFFGAFGGPVSV